MYLEISARQTGKTTRLVKQVVDDLESGRYQRAMVMTMNHRAARDISRLIPHRLLSRVITQPSVGLTRSIADSDITRCYYDEFCYITTEYFDDISPNGYYASTPRGGIVMEDIISRLIRDNKGTYETYKNDMFEKGDQVSWYHLDSGSIDWQFSLKSFSKRHPLVRNIVPPELFQM